MEIAEVWERRHTGEPTPSIARRPGTQGSSILGVFEDSSGVAAGESLCVIRERPRPGTPTEPRGWRATVDEPGIGPIGWTGQLGSERGGPADW